MPEDYAEGKPAPLVLFLSGKGGTAELNNFTSEAFSLFRRKAKANGFIVAVPDYGPSRWFNETAESIVLEMLEFLRSSLRLEGKCHVMGCSMGGGSALAFAARHKEEVRSVCDVFGITDYVRFHRESDGHRDSMTEAFDGTPDIKPAAYLERSAINLVDGLKTLPTFVIHGDADTVVPKWHSDQLVERLRAAGGYVEYVVVPGSTHDNSIIAGLEDAVISFFKRNGGLMPSAKAIRKQLQT